jgi:predicted ester cyclase
MDISPTNNRVEMSGIDIVRFSDGKIVERWGEFDQAGLLQQLGVMPEPEMA